MIALTFLRFAKYGAILFFIISIFTGLLTGIVTYSQTGDWKPLAEQSIGKIVAADNVAFQMEKDIISGQLETYPQQYRHELRTSMLQTIFANMIISIIIIYGLTKLLGLFFEWRQPVGTKFDIVSIILAIFIYGVVGFTYSLIMTYYQNGIFSFDLVMLWGFVPFKSVVYGVWNVGGLIGL